MPEVASSDASLVERDPFDFSAVRCLPSASAAMFSSTLSGRRTSPRRASTPYASTSGWSWTRWWRKRTPVHQEAQRSSTRRDISRHRRRRRLDPDLSRSYKCLKQKKKKKAQLQVPLFNAILGGDDDNDDDDDILQIEVGANRYDLLCLEGLVRALKIFQGR